MTALHLKIHLAEDPLPGVSVSNSEFCTLSNMGGLTDLLLPIFTGILLSILTLLSLPPACTLKPSTVLNERRRNAWKIKRQAAWKLSATEYSLSQLRYSC